MSRIGAFISAESAHQIFSDLGAFGVSLTGAGPLASWSLCLRPVEMSCSRAIDDFVKLAGSAIPPRVVYRLGCMFAGQSALWAIAALRCRSGRAA